MHDQVGNPLGQMPDSQIAIQMRTQAAQAEASTSALSVGISPSAVRKPGSWNGSTPFRGFASSLTIYFRATGLAREHWGLVAAINRSVFPLLPAVHTESPLPYSTRKSGAAFSTSSYGT